MISVVITTHNSSAFVGDTLRSVAAQSRKREILDVVVVDSESSDGTVQALLRAEGECGLSLRVVRTENGGPSHARNRGLRETRGEWVQFLDGDDWLHLDKLACQLNCIDAAKETPAVVYSAWTRLGEDGSDRVESCIVTDPLIAEGDPARSLLERENFLAVGSQLFRREWLERVGGFDERLWLIEDVHLMLRIAIQGGLFSRAESAEPLFYYRQRSGSLSRRDEREFVEACIRNASMVERHWAAERALSAERRSTLAEVYRNGALYYALRDRRRFADITSRINALVPGYLPPDPPRVRRAAQLVGYRNAETLGAAWRHLSQAWQSPRSKTRN